MGHLKDLLAFAGERERIRVAKEMGKPWPWTQDTILQQYRFCNVRRNDDKETRSIHANWLKPNADHEDVWFAMAVARLVNWWPTLVRIGFPVPWQHSRFVFAVDDAQEETGKAFTGAYMIRADAHPLGKGHYLAEKVLAPLWEARKEVRPRKGDTLDDFHQRLMQFKDFGSFMAAQVVADAKYGTGWLSQAEDWERWAASGPGSRRGLARVLGRPVGYTWTEEEWRHEFGQMLPLFNRAWAARRQAALTGQDLQNVCCEYDKMERVRLGEGRPRSKYQPPVTVTKD